MHAMGATARAILVQLKALRIVFPVFGGGIVTFLALGAGKVNNTPGISFLGHIYSMMRLILPAPTVLPPSRMAKRKPFSRATG
jgi:hypothetical protein